MRVEWQIGIWIATALVLVGLLWLFSGVLLPFAAALALGYLLDPVADRLERLGLNRLGATLIILAVFIVVLALGGVLVVPILGRQLASFVQALPDYLVRLQALIAQESQRLAQDYGGSFLDKIGLGSAAGDIRGSANDLVTQAAQWAGGFARSLWTQGAALLSLLSLVVVTPVIAFYMLLDWDKMVRSIQTLVPPRHRPTINALAHQVDIAMAGFLRGQSLVCCFLGAWYGLGLTLVGLNFGLLIGITAGVLSFIPYVGSLTALILSAVVAIVQGWPSWNLLLLSLAVVGAGQFLEGNILSPKLVGASVGLHPVWLIFALLAFGTLFGFTGLIIAVPVAAAIGIILRFAMTRYRESPLYLGPPMTTGHAPVLIDVSAADRERR